MGGDYGHPIPSVSPTTPACRLHRPLFTRLLEAAPEGVPSVYEWDHGTLRLVGVLPDGEVAAEGAELAAPNPNGITATPSPPTDPVSCSSRPPAQFERFADAQLYARVDHTHTVWVSEPEGIGPPPTPENLQLQQFTGDSRHIIFSTTSKLLDADTNEGPDLYLYTESADPAHEHNLTLVTDAGNSSTVIGSSEDGSRIYYP